MPKMICFDMDGTIADLYGVPDWLATIRQLDPLPYWAAMPMCDMLELADVLMKLKAQGWEVRVITWLSKETTPQFDRDVREIKKKWLDAWEFPYDHFHGVAYGTTKANSVRRMTDYAILFDDNAAVRKGWHMGPAIDPAAINIVEYLKNLLGE